VIVGFTRQQEGRNGHDQNSANESVR